MKNYNNEKFNFEGLIILEMANNHQGSVEHGKKIINAFAPAVSSAGVKAAIKFQFRDLDRLIHPDHKDVSTNKHIPRFLSTRLGKDDFALMADEARNLGMITMATPFDEKSVDMLEELGIDVIKVASSSATDWPLLEKITKIGKPVVCSTGGLPLELVDNLVSFFNHRGVDFALMHCVSIYPTPNHKLNLERINIFKERYPEAVIGFSTHEDSGNIDAVKVAYAKGARVFEKHIGVETKNIKLNAYSANPEQFTKWLDSYNDAIAMVGAESYSINPSDQNELNSLSSLMRGVYAKNKIKRGDIIKKEDVFFAMPLQEGQMHSGQWHDAQWQKAHYHYNKDKVGLIADRDYSINEHLPDKLIHPKLMKKEIVYKAIHDVRGVLHKAHIFFNPDSSVELAHPYGVKDFFIGGLFMINCINREYCKKLVIMMPGQRFPSNYHTKREKTLQVLYGSLEIDIDGKNRVLSSGDSILIPSGVWHSFTSKAEVVFEEISIDSSQDKLCFADKIIDNTADEDRKTKLINWGRHQFDDDSEVVSIA